MGSKRTVWLAEEVVTVGAAPSLKRLFGHPPVVLAAAAILEWPFVHPDLAECREPLDHH